MSAITLAQARAMVDALMASEAAGGLLSISIAGRTITYASQGEFQKALDYWLRMVTQLERKAARLSRHGYAVADFRSRR